MFGLFCPCLGRCSVRGGCHPLTQAGPWLCHGHAARCSCLITRCLPLACPCQVSTGITMGPKYGIKVRLVPREAEGQQQAWGQGQAAAGQAGRALQEDSAPAGEMAAGA